MKINWYIKGTLIALLIGFNVSSIASSNIYRYQNGGSVVYGDKVPDGSSTRVDSISRSTGLVTDVKRYSDEEIALQKKQKEEALENKKKEEENFKKNAALLSKYSSIDEIDKRKNEEIERISNDIQKNITLQVNLEDQLKTLKRENERKPDNKKIQLELEKVTKELQTVLDSLERNKKAYSEKLIQYTEEKARYKKILEEKK